MALKVFFIIATKRFNNWSVKLHHYIYLKTIEFQIKQSTHRNQFRPSLCDAHCRHRHHSKTSFAVYLFFYTNVVKCLEYIETIKMQ